VRNVYRYFHITVTIVLYIIHLHLPFPEMHDPQQLTLGGSVKALLALGRIPLASEVPLWGLYGCLLSSWIFQSKTLAVGNGFDWVAAIQCVLVVWGTNISINYGNEYFDWDMDRPGMVASIRKDVEAREKIARELKEKFDGQAPGENEVAEKARKEFGNEKIMGSSSRIIHDGTFPPYVALACASFIQVLILGMILFSRGNDPNLSSSLSTKNTGRFTPFRGVALQIGVLCTFLSQTYVGPPLRLHYHGFGELVSAMLLSPVATLFGMVGYYTATTGRSIPFSDLFSTPATSHSGFYLDSQLWYMLAAYYFYEQARILVMHIHDIAADRKGGKITLVVRIGYDNAKRLYVVLNAISLGFFGLLANSFASGTGSLSKIGSNTIMLGGTGALLAFALPIIVITARSLFYHSPSNRGGPDVESMIPIASDIADSSYHVDGSPRCHQIGRAPV
jgi:1,4-dihydroxy-2-naphthoate octaprenyltransferase